jgi:hypothetical protein
MAISVSRTRYSPDHGRLNRLERHWCPLLPVGRPRPACPHDPRPRRLRRGSAAHAWPFMNSMLHATNTVPTATRKITNARNLPNFRTSRSVAGRVTVRPSNLAAPHPYTNAGQQLRASLWCVGAGAGSLAALRARRLACSRWRCGSRHRPFCRGQDDTNLCDVSQSCNVGMCRMTRS